MSETDKPPVLWSTIIVRWAVVVLLVIVILIALRPSVATWISPRARFQTSGDPADIRLIAVIPDGDDALYDPEGRRIAGEKFRWPGERDYVWPQSQMKRDLLLELGPGATNLDFRPQHTGGFSISRPHAWLGGEALEVGPERVPAASGATRLLVRASLSEKYWRRGFMVFGGGQAPVDTVNVTLQFYSAARGQALANFDGPFLPGRTNSPRDQSSVTALALHDSPRSSAGATFVAWGPWTSQVLAQDGSILAYDAAGKRHFGQVRSSSVLGGGWTNEFQFPDLPLERITAITFGEAPRMKTFHNILVRYPGRAVTNHSPVLDRLAVALGKTNVAPANLQHFQPRTSLEAFTILQFIPRHPSTLQALAYHIRTTNFNELTPGQREFLHQTATACGEASETQFRDHALRIGLRGGWPEFIALALERLTNGTPAVRLEAARALSADSIRLDAAHVPALLGCARAPEPPGVAFEMTLLLTRIRAPAATNALLELSRSDIPAVWWPAIQHTGRRPFEPFAALSVEMQQRVILATDHFKAPVSEADRAAAYARLPGLFTRELRRDVPTMFHEVFRRLTTRVERPVAMAAFLRYLRDAPEDYWGNDKPIQIIQQINLWHGKNFGGVGSGKGGYSFPPSDAWAGIIEDVIDFHDRQLARPDPAK